MAPRVTADKEHDNYMERRQYNSHMAFRGSNLTHASHILGWETVNVILTRVLTDFHLSEEQKDQLAKWLNDSTNLELKDRRENLSTDKILDYHIVKVIVAHSQTTINNANKSIPLTRDAAKMDTFAEKVIARLKHVHSVAQSCAIPIVKSIANILGALTDVDPLAVCKTSKVRLLVARLLETEAQSRQRLEEVEKKVFQQLQKAQQRERLVLQQEEEKKTFQQLQQIETEAQSRQRLEEVEKKAFQQLQQVQTSERSDLQQQEIYNRVLAPRPTTQLEFPKLVYLSKGCANGREVYSGPQGGLYFVTTGRRLIPKEKKCVVTILGSFQ